MLPLVGGSVEVAGRARFFYFFYFPLRQQQGMQSFARQSIVLSRSTTLRRSFSASSAHLTKVAVLGAGGQFSSFLSGYFTQILNASTPKKTKVELGSRYRCCSRQTPSSRP